MRSFDDLVLEFLSAEKVATRRFRWRGPRTDWVRAGVPLAVEGRRDLSGHFELAAHLFRKPEKYCFSLLFRRERVFGLDIDPGRAHTNLRTLQIIFGTHWQVWPLMEAMPDGRDLIYQQWLDEFLKRTKISLRFPPVPPPFGGQLRLDV
jgi:hypothetical protein